MQSDHHRRPGPAGAGGRQHVQRGSGPTIIPVLPTDLAVSPSAGRALDPGEAAPWPPPGRFCLQDSSRAASQILRIFLDRPSTTSSSRAGPLRSRTGVRSMITAGVLVAPLGVAPHKGGTSHLRAKRTGESSTSSISTPSKRPGSSSSADVHGSVRITVPAVCQATVRAAATREIDTDSRPRARPHRTAAWVKRALGWTRAEESCRHRRWQIVQAKLLTHHHLGGPPPHRRMRQTPYHRPQPGHPPHPRLRHRSMGPPIGLGVSHELKGPTRHVRDDGRRRPWSVHRHQPAGSPQCSHDATVPAPP